MGQLQGDNLPEPVYYTAEIDGETVTRPAYTPADHVNLKARGWVEAQDQQASPAEPAAAAEPAERPDGSPQRVAVKGGRPPQAGEPADGVVNG